MKRWIYNNLIVFDIWANVWLLGSPFETISIRLGRGHIHGELPYWLDMFRRLIDGLFYWAVKEQNHCVQAYLTLDPAEGEIWQWH